MSDEDFMRQALAWGREGLGLTGENPSVGALLVKDGVVIGAGRTGAGGRPHGETKVIADAGEAAKGATLYVTLEPCSHHAKTPPCVEAIIAAGIARVVSAMEDPDARVAGRGHKRLREAGLAVEVGLGARQARIDHRGHILRVMQGRPMVTLKLARTADGYAAGDDYDPRLHITGQEADRRVHEMRAAHDVIMIGIGTARIDDPLLTVRLPGSSARPLRVVLDPHLRLSATSRLCATAREFPTLVIGADGADAGRQTILEARGVVVARVAADRLGRLDLSAALRCLAARGHSRIFSEGGPRIGASLVMAGLADDVALITALRPLGRPGLPALDAPALAMLENRQNYAEVENTALGVDRLRLLRKIDWE